MVICKECGTKMNYKSDIVTEFSVRYEQIEYKTGILYQCPKCKEVMIS